MKSITQELKKQKRKQKIVKSVKSKKSKVKNVRKILENKENNQTKVEKYMKLLKKFEKITDIDERQELIKKYEDKYGKFTISNIDMAKKKYKEKIEEKDVDDEKELRLLKIYRKTEKYIKLLRKIESTKDPFKQMELRRQFDEEYSDDDFKIKISKEDLSDEDKNIRNFLLSINELAKDSKNSDVSKEEIIENILEMIEDFSEEEELNEFFAQKRKKIFGKIIDNFGFKMIVKFIEAFLEQDSDLDNFYYEYVNIPEIRQKINKFKFGSSKKSSDSDKSSVSKSDIPPSVDKKLYDTAEFIDKKCLEIYSSTPWLPFRIRKIYISVVEPTTLDDMNEYISKNTDHLLFKEAKWYQANKNIYKLLCSVPLFEKSQNNDVLTIKNLNIKIGYKIDLFDNEKVKELNDDNFVIQNEEMFENEKKYIKNYNLSFRDKINKIINEKEITDDISIIAKTNLSYALKRVSNFDDFYSENSEFVNKVINSLINNSPDVKTFIEKLGNIIIYLSYDIENASHKIFSNRIKSKYYLPEILVLLSPEEKLPEILGNTDISDVKKEHFAKSINIKLETFIQTFLRSIYDRRNPYEHIPTNSTKHFSNFIDKIPIKDWKEKCSNYEDIKDIPNENLLYYDEKGKTYCLNIRQLWQDFKNNNYKNPYTKKNLSKEFINNFNKTYNIIEEENVENEGDDEQQNIEVEEELTPDLIKLIEDDLNIEYLEEPEVLPVEPEVLPVEPEKLYSISLKELDPKIDDLYSRITDSGDKITKGQILKLLQKNKYDVDASEEYYNNSDEVRKKIEEEYNILKNIKTSKIDFEESDDKKSDVEDSDVEDSDDDEEKENKNKPEKNLDFESENEDEDESYKPTNNSFEPTIEFHSQVGDDIRGDLPIVVDPKTGWVNDKRSYKPSSKKSEIEQEKKCKNCLKICKSKFYKSFVGKKMYYFCSLKCMENSKF